MCQLLSKVYRRELSHQHRPKQTIQDQKLPKIILQDLSKKSSLMQKKVIYTGQPCLTPRNKLTLMPLQW